MNKYDDRLLKLLDKELRKPAAKLNDLAVEEYIQVLVETGVYPASTPAMKKNGYSHRQMAEGWGAWWHEWRKPHNCPLCGADLRDHSTGPPFMRAVLWKPEDHFYCPDCNQKIAEYHNPCWKP